MPKSIMLTPEEREQQEAMAKTLREIGQALRDECPEGTGFAIFMFSFAREDRPSNVAYVANGDRAGVIKILKDWIARVEFPS
jgi:hypothetical protein